MRNLGSEVVRSGSFSVSGLANEIPGSQVPIAIGSGSCEATTMAIGRDLGR